MMQQSIYVRFFNANPNEGTMEIMSLFMPEIPRVGDYVCLPTEPFGEGTRAGGRLVTRVFWILLRDEIRAVDILLARPQY